jgi:hypothetical protein
VRYDITYEPSRDRWYIDASWALHAQAVATLDQLRYGSVVSVDLNVRHLAVLLRHPPTGPSCRLGPAVRGRENRPMSLSSTERLQSLISAITKICGTPGPRSVRAAESCRVIKDATGVRWVGIYSVTGDQVLNEAWSGPSAPAHAVFASTQGLTAHAVSSSRPVLSNDVAETRVT